MYISLWVKLTWIWSMTHCIYGMFYNFRSKMIGDKSSTTNDKVMGITCIERWKNNILKSMTVSLKHKPKMSRGAPEYMFLMLRGAQEYMLQMSRVPLEFMFLMLRGAQEYMFQMSTIQLKALLNEACKVVDDVCTFLLSLMMRNLLPYDLRSSWPTWKSDSCLEMYWNWTSFCKMLEQS